VFPDADRDQAVAGLLFGIFGPVLVALPFEDEDDLVAQANATVYGLACGIWTGDYRRAWRVARRIDAGTVWINTYKQFSVSTPFGGFKDSGLGREKGRDGIRAYTRQKSLYWGLDESPLPWAANG
jgi:aldehyde dehydrogenase (NAD+)